jgi:chaperone modulatory protein CbpM
MDTIGFLHLAELDATVLETWIEAGWIIPRREEETRRFAEVDVARARLIHDLKHGIGVNDEGVAIILDLIDQIHGLRGRLRDVCTAVAAQPEAVRVAIATEVRITASGGSVLPEDGSS